MFDEKENCSLSFCGWHDNNNNNNNDRKAWNIIIQFSTKEENLLSYIPYLVQYNFASWTGSENKGKKV